MTRREDESIASEQKTQTSSTETDRQVLLRYLTDKLRSRDTYVIAGLVGTFINLYGHLLVPWMRGQANPLAKFQREFHEFPGLVVFSIGLAYCFPFAVGVFSAVTARFATRSLEYKALFPDLKPDPVFRTDMKGQLLDMGAVTESFFREACVKSAQDVVGESAWAEIVVAGTRGESIARGTKIFSKALKGWYLVSSSCGPGETLHIYMSPAPGD